MALHTTIVRVARCLPVSCAGVALSLAAGAIALAQSPPGNPPFELSFTGPQEMVIPMEGRWGLITFPDQSLSFRWNGGVFQMWGTGYATNTTPGDAQTFYLRGPTPEAIAPHLILGGYAVPVLAGSRAGFDSNYAGAGSVIPAANGRDLLMFYHAENHRCHVGDVHIGVNGAGVARSTDGGVTWQRLGQAVTSELPFPSTGCPTSTQGVGSPRVIPSRDGQWLYLYFSDFVPNQLNAVRMARAPIVSDGVPGSWQKYYNGGFTEPGVGGQDDIVIWPPGRRGFAAEPNVSFNTYLDRYLAVVISDSGLYATTSVDGITWAELQALPLGISSAYQQPTGTLWTNYATLMSFDQPSQITTSRSGYLYYSLGILGVTPHGLARRPFRIDVGDLRLTSRTAGRAAVVTIGDTTQGRDSVAIPLEGIGWASAKWTATAPPAGHVTLLASSGQGADAWLRWSRNPARLLRAGTAVDTITLRIAAVAGLTMTVMDTVHVAEPELGVDCAVDELLGGPGCLSDVQQRYLDLTGNSDGAYNLGDLISYLDRKQIMLPAATFDRLPSARTASRPGPPQPVTSPARRIRP